MHALEHLTHTEIDMASGLAVDHVEAPALPRRRRALLGVGAVLAGLFAGLAAGWAPSPAGGGGDGDIVRSGLRPSALAGPAPSALPERNRGACAGPAAAESGAFTAPGRDAAPDGAREAGLHE